jgi:hypothetical protein
MTTARNSIADFWDAHISRWLAGEDPMPEPLPRWYDSYAGRGRGEVTRDAFPEAYGGDLRGAPRMVILGLNPGGADPQFQGRDGIFANEIRQLGSYSKWTASVPYMREPWTSVNGDNRYGQRRLRFARTWLEERDLTMDQILTPELYPWHSARVTAAMEPPVDVIDRFVWQPLAEIDVEFVFAFGKPWLRQCEKLGLPEVRHWDAAELGSPVESRTVVAFALPSRQWVVVSCQKGFAGPPKREDALRLRDRLREARRRAGRSGRERR